MRRILVLLLFLAIGLGACATPTPGGEYQTWLNETNATRAYVGAPAVWWDTQLRDAAQLWSEHLCATQRFYHQNLAGLITILGHYDLLSEVMTKIPSNISDFHASMVLWMGSPAHRMTVLNPAYGVIGVGHTVCIGDGNDYWVMDLGRSVG